MVCLNTWFSKAHIGKNIDFLGFLDFFMLFFKIIWNNHNKS
jgi:hypothetical protein